MVTALVVAGLILQLLDRVLAVPGESAAWRVLGSLGWGAWAGAAHLGLGGSATVAAAAAAAGAGAGAANGGHLEPIAARPSIIPRDRRSHIAGWLGAGLVVLLGEGLRHMPMGAAGASADAAVASTIEVWPAAASIVVFALAPALGEELFFRGPALRWLARRWGPALAWIGSTAAFAMVHPNSAAVATVLGAAFATLALATGRARESVLAHAAHNLLGLGTLGLWAC